MAPANVLGLASGKLLNSEVPGNALTSSPRAEAP